MTEMFIRLCVKVSDNKQVVRFHILMVQSMKVSSGMPSHVV
jgi:hypothetical protein